MLPYAKVRSDMKWFWKICIPACLRVSNFLSWELDIFRDMHIHTTSATYIVFHSYIHLEDPRIPRSEIAKMSATHIGLRLGLLLLLPDPVIGL